MYRTMAGVSAAEPGYRKVLVAPQPGAGIETVDYTLATPYGQVRSDWSTLDGPMTLDVTVPANSTAEVRIPAANRWAVTEGGRTLDAVDDVRFVGKVDGDVVLEVGSGTYAFAVDDVLGDLGAAGANTDAFAGQVAALDVEGPRGRNLQRHLGVKAEELEREISVAWEARLGDAEDATTATAVHRALGTVADLDRWVETGAQHGHLAAEDAESLRSRLAAIERRLSSASAALVGVVATVEVPAVEILPGDVVPVVVSVENAGRRPLAGVDSTLRAPVGWTVAPSGKHGSTVAAGETVTHAYDVTVPADAEASTVDVTGNVSYERNGGAATLPVGAALVVAPGVGIDEVTSSPDPVVAGEDATLSAVLTNRTDVEQSGELTLTLPDGWTTPDPVAYELAPGEHATTVAVVSVPLTVAEGRAEVVVATGPTAAERATGSITVSLPTPPSRSTDHVDLGGAASESAHGLTASTHSGTNTEAGLTRRYTHSSYPGGWYEFDVDVPTDGAFVVRMIETFDGARRKTYDVLLDGGVVRSVDLTRSAGGEGTVVHQFVVEPSTATVDGTARVRFQDTGADYDPSIADVWVVPVD
jgi:hypothetical protein